MKSARVAVPLAVLALAAGCGTPGGGTAFQVDGQRVGMAQVDDSAAGCGSLVQQEGSAIRDEVARMLLAGKLAEAVSRTHDVAVTPAMTAASLSRMQGESLLADADCATAVRGLASYAALNEKMGQRELARAVQGLDVQVNPRFGGWDAARGTFTGGSGSLSMQDVGQGQVFGGR